MTLEKKQAPVTFENVRLEDVDRAIRDWFDKTVDSHVLDHEGQRKKVKVIFASGERFVTGRDSRGVRDKDGRLILPIIVLRRTSLDPVNGMLALGANIPKLQISRVVSQRSNILKNAASQRIISQRNLNESTVYEVSTIPFPFTGVARYELIVQAQYVTQMNEILEKILSQLEFFDVPSFVAPLRDSRGGDSIKQGDGSTELIPVEDSQYDQRSVLDKYYVCGYLDGDFGDTGNLDEFTDQERIVKYTSSFKVPVYLLLDPEGKKPASQTELTAARVRVGDEQVCFVDDPLELEVIFGNGSVSVKEIKTR